jgi:hypothetical protein
VLPGVDQDVARIGEPSPQRGHERRDLDEVGARPDGVKDPHPGAACYERWQGGVGQFGA